MIAFLDLFGAMLVAALIAIIIADIYIYLRDISR